MPDKPVVDMMARLARASQVFRPSGPIDRQSLFAGRQRQILDVMSACAETGRHAAIFGERGVGKTSLAKVVHEFMPDFVISIRVNCDQTDTFSTIWEKVVDALTDVMGQPGWPHGEEAEKFVEKAVEFISGGEIGPDRVRHAMHLLSQIAPTVVFLDEFERVSDPVTKTMLADTVKTLSDNLIYATLVIVGVADDVDGLISEHQSIARALAQIPMPRMQLTEIEEIYEKGFSPLEISVPPEVRHRLIRLPQGIPHFAHRLGYEMARCVIHDSRYEATADDLADAITASIKNADESLTRTYTDATSSSHKTLYSRVLLACALTHVDEMGYFNPGDLRGPLQRITGEVFEIPRFAHHLVQFCNERGPVLERRGREHRWRYRFIDPMMRPYVVMRAIDDGISEDVLAIAPGQSDPDHPQLFDLD